MNSKFSSIREIKETLTPIGQKQSGGLVLHVDEEGAFVEKSESHGIIIGSSGSGKTRRMTIPTIMSLIASEESFLIGDSKGDVRDATYCYAKEKGYRTVMLDFRDIEHSTSLNFLMYPYLLYKKGETDKASDIVSLIRLCYPACCSGSGQNQ